LSAWTVQTEIFDGPLDLLLYLVKRDGIELRQVSISRIADSYLAYLDRMRELHLGVAAEYLVLAATLCHLKSIELLPRPPTDTSGDEEPEDPREVLVRRLVEHQRYREAAEALEMRPMLGRDSFAREPEEVPGAMRPMRAGIDAFGLLDLYHELLRRREKASATYDLAGDTPDIGGCCRRVLVALGGPGGRGELRDLLQAVLRPVERVLTFLSVLEMARLRWISIEQLEHLGPVFLTSRVEPDLDLSPVVGRFEVVGA
jgi:segregation and condensation protein A